jgi:hypothetical protein
MNQLYSFQPIETEKKQEKKSRLNRFVNFANFFGYNPRGDSNAKPDLKPQPSLDKSNLNDSKTMQIFLNTTNPLRELSIKKGDSLSKDDPKSSRNDSDPERMALEKLAKSGKKIGHGIFDLRKSSNRKQKHDLTDVKNFKEWAEIHQKKQKVTMTIFEFLKLHLVRAFHLKMSPKEKMNNEAQQIFAEEMDVIPILKKLQEVEKLKRILLNDNQLCLFNFLSKPMIYHNMQQNAEMHRLVPNLRRITFSKTKDSSSLMGDSQKISKIYLEMKNAENLEDIDGRLMRLLDKNFQNFIENLKRDYQEKN